MVLTFHAKKGGVGKTTLSANCAYLAASMGRKTVLVDADPQGNSSYWLTDGAHNYELADLMMEDKDVKFSDVLVQLGDKFWLLPTNSAGRLKDYAEQRLFREPHAFDDLNDVLLGMGMEVVIYDLGPGMSQLERCVIAGCGEVVFPALGESFSVAGVEQGAAEIRNINKSFRRDVRFRRLVVNMLNKSYRRHTQSLAKYKELDFEVYEVPQDAKVGESQFMHQTLPAYYPKSKALPELERLTAAIVGG